MQDDYRLDVRFFAPPADLGPCFTTFYRLELDMAEGAALSDQLQPEWSNLRFFACNPPVVTLPDAPVLRGARFQASGPSSRISPFTIGRTRMWGVGLLPLGWARYVGTSARASADTLVNGDTSPVFRHFAPLARRLCRPGGDDESDLAAIQAYFRDHSRPGRHDDKIVAIHAAMIDPAVVQVSDLSAATGLTNRTLERSCLQHFGFTPRVLLRRQRLMRTLAAFMLGDQAHWSDTLDAHYHDHAHFVHEFHAFMGMSPGEYARLPHPILSAFMAQRQRVWGSPVQTLDKPRRQGAAAGASGGDSDAGTAQLGLGQTGTTG